MSAKIFTDCHMRFGPPKLADDFNPDIGTAVESSNPLFSHESFTMLVLFVLCQVKKTVCRMLCPLPVIDELFLWESWGFCQMVLMQCHKWFSSPLAFDQDWNIKSILWIKKSKNHSGAAIFSGNGAQQMSTENTWKYVNKTLHFGYKPISKERTNKANWILSGFRPPGFQWRKKRHPPSKKIFTNRCRLRFLFEKKTFDLLLIKITSLKQKKSLLILFFGIILFQSAFRCHEKNLEKI